ncbi:YggS family pyridoxal phosphate-dependent enzyme [Colwelliaceae bacterium MEBiC 14330]
MINIKNNIDKVKAQILQACYQTGRLTPDNIAAKTSSVVTLLAVSKTKPAEVVEQAYLAGQRSFGENYLQEAVEKVLQLAHLPAISWHFIGPIQSNKTKQIAQNFSWVHSVDREKIVLRLNQHRQEESHNTPLNICLQVNISQEQSKSGVTPEEVFSLAELVNNCDKLILRGIMAIPEKNAKDACYLKMQSLFNQLKSRYASVDTLSLGMSNDLDKAIAHGSTMVRIGTAIFGARENKI